MRLVWLVWSLRAQGEGPTERGKPLAIFSPHQPRRTKGLPSPLAVYFSSSLLDKIPYFTFPNPCEWLHILVRMHSFQKERVDDWYWSRRVSRARGSILDRHYVIYVKVGISLDSLDINHYRCFLLFSFFFPKVQTLRIKFLGDDKKAESTGSRQLNTRDECFYISYHPLARQSIYTGFVRLWLLYPISTGWLESSLRFPRPSEALFATSVRLETNL